MSSVTFSHTSNCSLPRDFKYGLRGRFGSVEVTHVNGAPALAVNGKTIYTKPVTKSTASNYLQVVDPHCKNSAVGFGRTDTDTTETAGESYVDRSLTETLNQTEHTLLNINGFEDESDKQWNNREMNDNSHKFQAEARDNVFTVEADVEPLPTTSRTIPDIIVTSMGPDMEPREGKIHQKMTTAYGRSKSDNTGQTSKDKAEILSAEIDRSKSEPQLEKSSFPILLSIKQLFRKKKSPKSSTSDDETRSQTQSSYFGISKFFLPKPQGDFLFRSKSIEEGEHGETQTPLDEQKAFSDSELECSPALSPEMKFKRHTKKNYHYHCASWNELSESQKGKNVELSLHSSLGRINCEKPRMLKGMSIEHLDKIIIRRANSAFMERRKKRTLHDRKSQSLNEKRMKENTSTKLERSVSDPCITVSLIRQKLETQTFAPRRWSKTKKSKRFAKGKGHVCFVDLSDLSNDLRNQVLNHTNIKDEDVTRRIQDLPDTQTSSHENDTNCLCREDADSEILFSSPEESTSLLPETADLGSDGHKLNAKSRLVGSHSYLDVRKQLTCLTEGHRPQGYHSIDILDSVADNSFLVFGRSNPVHQRFADPFYRERYRDSITQPSVDENGIKETFI